LPSVAAAASTKQPFDPLGLFHSLKNIVQTEGGFHSLFRGNLAATYLWIGYAAVQFSLYARTSDFITSFQQDVPTPLHLPVPLQQIPLVQKPAQFASDLFATVGSNPTAVAFCSGAAAGTAATLATYPFDICRTAFASQRTMSQGTKSITTFFQLAMKNNPHPIRTIFAGSGPAVLGIIPYMGLNFALYDYLIRKGDRVKVTDAGSAGAISGGVSKIIVYPMDTVKKRLQAQAFETFWGNAERKMTGVQYRNMIDCASHIMREEGPTSFYRGLVPTVVKTMGATSLTFAIFQMTKNTLETTHDWIHRKNGQIAP
jgi:solute carrier family 25 thiamine pyrophosphate transporter 19